MIQKLVDCGQCYWLDTLSRELLQSGELRRRVKEESVTGITANPETLYSALTSSNDSYRPFIKRSQAASPKELYEELVLIDVREACDILRPVYDETQGCDGFVSIEISPHVAHDPDQSLAEARRLYQAAARDNLMVKIPATQAGLRTVEELVSDGIHVNATLLFSVQRYAEVAQAHLRGLERRVAAGLPVGGVASVASFFVGHIDALVDALLAHRSQVQARRLQGRAGIANARLAYQAFLDLVGSERWQRLRDVGAHEQRLLWAGTSPKDSKCPHLKYVAPLVAPQTVNTMTFDTIEELRKSDDEPQPPLKDGCWEAREILVELRDLGLDIDYVSQRLEDEGIQKLVEPYDASLTYLRGELMLRAHKPAPLRASSQAG